MIDFPTNEAQAYSFTIRLTDYFVNVVNGNFEVQVNYGSDWETEEDDSHDYWIGVVYAYKMTDDDTLNVYDSQDYRMIAHVCQRLGQVPEFDELEEIVGYRQGMGESDYSGWEDRADRWLQKQQLKRPVHPLVEGAD